MTDNANTSLSSVGGILSVVAIVGLLVMGRGRDEERVTEEFVNRHAQVFSACRHLSTDPQADRFAYTLKLAISPKGAVSDVQILERPDRQLKMSQCVMRRARELTFSSLGYRQRKAVTVTVPLSF